MEPETPDDIRAAIIDNLEKKVPIKQIKFLTNKLDELEKEEAKAKREQEIENMMEGDEKFSVLCQEWEESERGWGCRSDGFSIHLNEGDAKQFATNFWKRQREISGPGVPSEYTRESGKPFWVCVTKSIFQELENYTKDGKFGIKYASYCSSIKQSKTGERFLIIQD